MKSNFKIRTFKRMFYLCMLFLLCSCGATRVSVKHNAESSSVDVHVQSDRTNSVSVDPHVQITVPLGPGSPIFADSLNVRSE